MGGVFVVSQTKESHGKIVKLLNDLRDRLRKTRPAAPVRRNLAAMQPESPFTTDGRIAKWVRQLLIKARAGKLSKFSSVRLAKAAGRTFARISGIWFDTSLTEICQIYAVARKSAAEAVLNKTGDKFRACLALGKHVIVKVDENSAICLNRDGISKTDNKKFKHLLQAIRKPQAD